VTVTATSVRDNRATGGAGVHGGNGRGGGLYLADTTACIVDSSIRDNEANGGDGVTDGYGKGGGIYIVGGAVGIKNTKIKDNKASTSYDDVFGVFDDDC
jgi:hypothetical protein